MGNRMVTHEAQQHNGRFVSPVSEYEQGKQLYRRGKRITECVTDDMAAGWLDAEAAGADAYYRAMMAQAAH